MKKEYFCFLIKKSFSSFSFSLLFSFPFHNELQFWDSKQFSSLLEFLDCCSSWLFSLITKSKIEKNTKLIINYFIRVSDIFKRFDYYNCNTAFYSSYIKYSNYCGGSYVDFLKQTLQLAQVSPAFKTTIKVDTNSPYNVISLGKNQPTKKP